MRVPVTPGAVKRALRPRTRLVQSLNRHFKFWERQGIHVTPVHFYSPIPDTRTLPESLWTQESDLVGIDMRPQSQLDLLARLATKFRAEYETFPTQPTSEQWQYYRNQRLFGTVDAEFLYCMVRDLKPRRIIEVGSGMSTRLFVQAIGENIREGAEQPEYLVVDPYPVPLLAARPISFLRLLRTEVQHVPMEHFEALSAGDILFIDSSHTVRIGGDVPFLYGEVLPRLQPGVVIHAHDIFLPGEYHRFWVHDWHLFWGEQYVLRAFLSFNTAFEVLLAAQYLHRKHPGALAAAFPSYRPGVSQGASFWMRRSE